ncbi:MAG TPA: PadR family transcriptional regulator [Saprospiraceae bacterium]|nr:PadR family transcriptional regulator [Saprospiraceae bacterium]
MNKKLLSGTLSTIILKLLQDHNEMYGYEIVQKVKDLTQDQLEINEGALYPALHKLEASGLLTVAYKKYQNRVRKYYRLTEEGTKETQSQLEDLKAFMQQLQQLLNGSTDATLVSQKN